MTPAAVLLAAAVALQSPVSAEQAAPASAHISAFEIRGNHTTPDDVVIGIAGAKIGDPFTDQTLAEMKNRLEKSDRFAAVDVLKRYQSLTDFSAVLVLITLKERAGVSVDVPMPGPMRVLKSNTMWLPMLRYEDGYGFTYGARVSFVDVLGKRSRLSVPLTWGGERRATVELERGFERGPFTRVLATGGVWRREHPTLDTGDRREGGTLLVGRAVTSWLRVGGTASSASVHFGGAADTLSTAGVEATLDTRRDPAFPRNAIFASVQLERLWFDHAQDTSRLQTDVRGFVGLFGSSVLALRVQQSRAADPLPVFEQALLGGTASLRGFGLGYRYGDRLAAGTLELRLPISSPRHFGRAGLAIFADSGAVYDTTTTLDRAKYDTGFGAGWFLQAPVVSFRLDVAHGIDHGTRAHLTMGVTF